MYQRAPETHGIHFDHLAPGSVVDAVHVQGNLRITGSDRAKLLFRTSYEGTITIEGAASSRDGQIGFSRDWPPSPGLRYTSATTARW